MDGQQLDHALYIASLITKMRKGDALHETEVAELSKWENETEENKSLFKELLSDEEIQSQLDSLKQFDIEAAKKRIAEKLSTKGTEVFKSSDLLSFDNGSSYTYFKQLIDSLHIEGFLLVQLSSKSEEQMGSPPGGSPGPTSHAGPGVSASAGVSVSITLYTANFDCMLIDSKSLNSPKWKAQLESKQANSNRELQQNMARLLAKSLMSEGYIVMSAKASAKAHDTRGPEF